MATVYENVAYLSQEIGPRPAGTEEEQKAALYITEQIQTESGLPAIIEDFQCSPDYEIPKTICCIVAILTMLLSIFAPILNLILVVLAGIAAALFAAEAFDMPVLSRFFARGMSQNVVARYEPGFTDKKAGRKRKVIFIARYDSGKVSRETTSPLFHLLPLIRWIELFGIIANFVVLLLRAIINPMGVALIVFNVLSIITMAICVLPILGMVFHQISAYNEGANCNASGIAVLMELANRIGRARVSATELQREEAVVIHGEEEARKEGLLPEDAEVVYEEQTTERQTEKRSIETQTIDEEVVEEGSAEERLRAAKAAVAALSGRPVSDTINITFDEDVRKTEETSAQPAEVFEGDAGAAETLEAAAVETVSRGKTTVPPTHTVDQTGQTQVLSAGAASRSRRIEPLRYPAPQPTAASKGSEGGVPDWFSRAQKNAKRIVEKPAAAQRSRYAQAYDAAQATMAANREAQAPELSETQRRLQEFRDAIAAPTPAASTITVGEAQALNETVEQASAAITEAADVEAIEAVAGGDALTAEAVTAEAAPAEVITAEATPVEAVAAKVEATPVEETVAVREEVEPPAGAEAVNAMPRPARERSASKTAGLDSLFGLTVVEEVKADTAEKTETRESVIVKSADDSTILDQTRAFVPVKLDLDEFRSLDKETVEAEAAAKPATTPAEADAEVVTIEERATERPKASRKVPTPVEETVEVTAEAETKAETETQEAPVSQLDAMRAAIPAIRIESEKTEEVVEESADDARNRIAEGLPSITMGSLDGEEGLKQRAPLAEEPQTPTGRVRELRSSLPHLGVTNANLFEEGGSGDLNRDALRNAVPSLSGVIAEQATTKETVENTSVSQAASFAASSATGAFEPIGDELVEDIAPEDRYVDDVDDSAYAETMTETGAFSGPGYVEMPESRVKRLFGRFRRNKRNDEDEGSPQEWLDVDEEFDARSVGAARGGWESFREDDDEAEFDETVDELDIEEDEDFDEDRADRAKRRSRPRRSASSRSSRPSARRDRPSARRSSGRRWHGGAFSGEEREKLGRVSTASEDTAQETEITLEEATTGKSGEIFRFRHPEIDVEVWFVALGAELANNAGMNAFLAEHRSELRGATIIELEGIGAGDLSFVDREGMYLSRESSTRIERLLRKAASSMGSGLGTTSMEWRSSATAYALSHGYQALQVIGELDGKPAFFGEEDDVVENIDEEMLELNADLLMELLKNV